MNFSVVIPTYNAGNMWDEVISSIKKQSMQPEKVIVIDSNSTDGTVLMARNAGFYVHSIQKQYFDHGGTRTKALELVETDLVIYMTQDAILHDNESIARLISCFRHENVGAVYGRQLPHVDANPLAIHARLSNYGDKSYMTSLDDEFPKGFRKAFMSNSFSCYRVDMLRSLGGFPQKLILGEDSYIAARMLMDGVSVGYESTATARHSHNYSAIEEFKRYFDIGVFHRTQDWMLTGLGNVEGEGVKFAVGQIVYFIKNKQFKWAILSCVSSGAKYLGYKLGKNYTKLNKNTCRKLSMYKGYWGDVS
ncbi:glycosyltransferase [Pectobacterium aroidearum]|uniref:Glycosyltransferase n=2 Tax=Pectobacterium aroidearum TaxID=1201031 RepID=A0AAW3SNH1_9GAMM|nr:MULTISPECIES: glycosyltransferase family A protein [Pectobacterium]KHS98741.1 O antigen biosynthesis rhamnosyltransferase rfbn [Pectobacterium brasiliense]MBA5199705.1 glycosyltransferase [Pectobacterium aroidearum]MBA5202744.1 glycosyltransferase [Pectobacterium aroidearum]MBA5228303.1 glycosyltransferase [Pectobacterium aroidearum]MBA5232497.1 glycosyltransferase [Pectobacterium aroidearum]